MADLDDLTLLAVHGEPITIGDLRSGLEALPGLDVAIKDIIAGKESWSDDETIATDALAILVIAAPQAAALVAIGKIAIAIAPLLAGIARPDPDPIRDAQTTGGRGGRRTD